MRNKAILVGAISVFLSIALTAFAKPTGSAARLRPDGIVGTVYLVNSASPSDSAFARFMDAAGGDKAKLVVVVIGGKKPDGDAEKAILAPLQKMKPAGAELLWVGDREQADDTGNAEKLHNATGVWIAKADTANWVKTIRGTKLIDELQTLLDRRGALAVQGDACGLLASGTVRDDRITYFIKGLKLLPDCIVDTRFDSQTGGKSLRNSVAQRTGQIGIGLPKDTTLEIHGREIRPLDDGSAYVELPPGTNWHQQNIVLTSRRLADWNQLHRAARDRANANYLPREPTPPEVPHGSLVIIGGGGTPRAVLKKFVELAGGPDANFVVFPTAMPDPLDGGIDSTFLQRVGLKHVTVFPARELKEVDTPENLEIIKKASGVWFGGGRQWRFVDCYEGTKTAEAVRGVLARGGVIAGSSAGATIQGDYLVRGSPFSSEIMMCEGYERGLGFLTGVAIDQHFSVRNRFADMTSLIKKYPQFLGIGLDESTAIVVQGHVAEIMGKGKVHFYDSHEEIGPYEPDYDIAMAGDHYDLKLRRVIPGPRLPEAKPEPKAEKKPNAKADQPARAN